MPTLVIVGAGPVGAAAAQQAAGLAIATRVVLVDPAAEVARGLALDLCQSGAVTGTSTWVDGTGDTGAVVGAPVVILADRYGAAGEWRGDEALQLAASIRGLNPRAMLVCAGAGQHDVVERLVLERDADRRRIAGSAAEALRAGLTAMAALEASAAPTDVVLSVVGRPPRNLFVPWEGASIAGVRAADVLPPPVIGRLDRQTPYLWPPGPLALGAAAARLARLVLTRAPGLVSAFVVPPSDGDGVVRGVVVPVAVVDGAIEVRAPQLAPRDRVRFER